MNIRWCLLFIFLFPFVCFSQIEKSASNNWAENWLSTNISLKLNDYWKINFENQFRIKHIDENFDRNFIEIDVQRLYKSEVADVIIGGSYRHLLINDDIGTSKSIESHNRFSFYIAQKIKIDRYYIKGRIQYQSRKELLPEINLELSDYSKYWRFKSEFGYNIKNWKLDPEISIEYFSRNKNHYWNQYNKLRFALGTKYNFNKKNSIGIKYMLERQIRDWNPELIHIFGIKYSYQIKHQTSTYKEFINEE
tara:strand:+ start:3158 stop:3907 length:750 start_codon:yes stop_codon:yes gene_type:complete